MTKDELKAFLKTMRANDEKFAKMEIKYNPK